MKILTAKQTQTADQYTIQHEPVSSIDLMERASIAFTRWFCQVFKPTSGKISVFCGPGNNGGDGLAIARMLFHKFYEVEVWICKIGHRFSDDFLINKSRLETISGIPLREIEKNAPLPDLNNSQMIIDGIFGSGLNRPVEGYWANLIEHLNNSTAHRVAIDIPSGTFADSATTGTSFKADFTCSFELPKLAFFMPGNYLKVGEWVARPIGLHPKAIEKAETNHYYIDQSLISTILKKRKKFDHKGTYGHALLVGGSYGKIGAIVLSTKACLRTGAGLVSVYLPKCGYEIIQSTIPEAMVYTDGDAEIVTSTGQVDLSKHKAIGIGPGMGTDPKTINGFYQFLKNYEKPIVIDADALNILSQRKNWLEELPSNSILTPHPGEFRRLFGDFANDFDRLQAMKMLAEKYEVIIVLKGAHSSICTPAGEVYFNSTGNPGMATGGSGDVLTGIITGLLAQSYSPKEAAILGVYLHGMAGDLAAQKVGQESLIAGDIVNNIGISLLQIRQ